MSNAFAALHTVFSVGAGGPPLVYTAVAKVAKIGNFDMQKADVDITTYGSNGFKEYLGTLKDGAIDLELIWIDDTTQDGLLTNFLTIDDPQAFQIAYPAALTTKKWQFTALITGFSISHDLNGVYRATVKMKLSGLPTYA